MDEPTVGALKPTASPQPLCPHCLQPFVEIGWLSNPDAQLLTVYHNSPACMKVINCQFVQMEQRRVALPGEFQPRGRG